MWIIGLLAFVVVQVSATGREPPADWVSMISSTSKAELVRANDDPEVCSSIYSCHDCNTARVCKPTADGNYELLQTIPCPNSRPYCEPTSGSCVADEPANCGKEDNFICLGNEKYPDSNCSVFHACIELRSFSFACSEGRVYNARSQVCEEALNCGTFDCAGSDGSKVAHSIYSGYYAYCHQGNGPLVVDACQGNYELNITSQLCEPTCHQNGIQPDVNDCHFYYKCTNIVISRDTTYFQKQRLQCPTGQAYSTNEYLCIDESQVAACQHT